MILLELFSGIGGFAAGLEQAGLQFRKVYFSEVDKHAIANYQYNFKDAEYIGSVKHVRAIINTIRTNRQSGERLIITFGSPCQDFSLAGKRSGLDGAKSSLIKYALFLIRWLKPDVYIWENVKGAYSTNAGADFWAIWQAFANIDGYGLEQQLLNTAWFLPQNRERIYVIGHLRGRSECGVFPIAENNTIHNQSAKNSQETYTTASCLMAEAYNKNTGNYIKVEGRLNSSQDGLVFSADGISQCLSAGNGNVPKIQIPTNTIQGYEEATIGDTINLSVPNSTTRRGRIGKQKAQTLDTAANQAVIVKQINESLESGGKQPYQQNRVYDATGLAPTIDQAAVRWSVQPVLTPDRLEKRQNGRRFKEDGEPAFTLNCQDQHGVMINNTQIRRLTEIECERLQGFADNWTKFGVYDGVVKPIPKTQRYKMCGNAVSVCIPKAIGERLIFLND